MTSRAAKTPLMQLALGGVILFCVANAHAKGLFNTDPAEGGFYVSGFAGAGFPNDVRFKGTQNPAVGSPGLAGSPAEIKAGFDTDVYFGGALGYRLPYKFLTYFRVVQCWRSNVCWESGEPLHTRQ